MSDILDIVRSRIGQRHKISRREMADLLAELSSHGLDLRNGYLGMTLAGNNYDSPQSPNAHEVWANACREITCISVDTRGLRDGYVRFDAPGSMYPDQHAELLFAPAALADYEYDQIGQMRRHADRVLIVDGPAIEPPAGPGR